MLGHLLRLTVRSNPSDRLLLALEVEVLSGALTWASRRPRDILTPETT